MAHEIHENCFVYRGKPGWHGVGSELPEEHKYNMSAAFTCGGATYPVETFPIYDAAGNDLSAYAKGVRRTDTGAVLAVNGPSFHPIQWDTIAKAYQSILDARLATVETVGVLRGGARIFALIKLETPMVIVPGDEVQPYGMIAHGHDGLSVKMGPTAVRIVCNNTLQAALASGAGKIVSIKHRKNAAKTVGDVGHLFHQCINQITAWADFARSMSARHVTQRDVEAFLKKTFPERFTFRDPADAMLAKLGIPVANEATPSEKFLAQFMDIFEGKGAGSKLPGVRGTLWGLYNAATELTQHHTGFRSAATRTDSILFGSAADTDRKAQKAARELLAA